MQLRRFLLFASLLCAFSPQFLFSQSASGTIPSTGGGTSCVLIDVTNKSTVGIQVTGTWSGTLQPQISIQGQAPQNIQVTPYSSSTAQSTITANGNFVARVGGGSTLLLCGNTVGSGTANVWLNATEAVSLNIMGPGSGLPSGPLNSVQFNCAGSFCGDSNFLWDNTNKGVTLGPTTNIGYITLINVPRLYSESQQNGLTGNSQNAFTISNDFRTFLNPSADSTIEAFNSNFMIVVQAASTHNLSNELAAEHGEGDNNGQGTVASMFGNAGEAFQIGPGRVTQLTADGADCGTFGAGSGGVGTCDVFGGGVFATGSGLMDAANGLHIKSPSLTGGTSTVTAYHAIQIDDPATGGALNPNPMGINIGGSSLNDLGAGGTRFGYLDFVRATTPATTDAYLYAATTSGSIIFGRNSQDAIQFFLPGTADAGTMNFGVNGIIGWSAHPGTLSQDACFWHVSSGFIALGASGCNTIGASLGVTGLFLGATNTGWTQNGVSGTGRIADFEIAGTNELEIDNSVGLTMTGTNGVMFSATTGPSRDSGVSRVAPKVLSSGNATLGDTSGFWLGGYAIPLKATNSLTAGQVVKADTSNANQIVVAATTDTAAGIALGILQNSPLANATGYVVTSGIVSTPLLGTGTCSIGNFVIVDTTTAGRVKCTATFTAGTVIGRAVTAQAVVGSAVTVAVGLQ